MNRLLGMLTLITLLAASMASGQTRVVYPANESAADSRFNDLAEILKTALDKTVEAYGPYTLEPSKQGMNEARSLTELLKSDGRVNVAWGGTSEQRETDYRALRIPLRKGILGFRIAFIAKGRQADIDRILSLDDLRKASVGQGIGWGDTAIYESNGINVHTAAYESLFKMVALNRVDLFPRGISEVFQEYAARRDAIPNLAIEENLLIYYPWPYYFFFNKSNDALAQRIETGIREMMNDGSFDALFRKYNGAAIEKANLKQRRVIRLANPGLPKDTPLGDASLWFDPAKWK